MPTEARSIVGGSLVVLAFLLILPHVGLAADADPELSNQLESIRGQWGTIEYAQAAKLTEPLLRKYAQDKDALARIYRLRADFSFHRNGSWNDRYAESKALLPLLPPNAADDINLYEDWLVLSARFVSEKAFDAAYATRVRRGGTSEKDVASLLRAHTGAVHDYINRWNRPADSVAACKAMLAICDFTKKEHTDLVYQEIERFLLRKEKVKPQDAYEIVQAIRSDLHEDLGKSWAARILPHALALEEQLGKPEAMLQTADELMKLSPQDAGSRVYRAKSLEALKKHGEADAQAREVILGAPDDPQAFSAAVQLVTNALAQGKKEDALRRARTVFDVASSRQEINEAIQLVAQVLSAIDGNLVRANQFILFQKYGQAGLDGKAGTEDDLPDFTKVMERSVDPQFVQQLMAEAEKINDMLDAKSLRKQGMLFLYAGQPQKALEAFQKEYLLIVGTPEGLAQSSGDVAAALRAASGQLFGSKAFLDFQQYGHAGIDAMPGTADDLSFAFLPLAPLPDDAVRAAEDAFHQELLQSWTAMPTFEKGFRYASALSLAGRRDEALSVARTLYFAARDEQTFNAACVAVAAALRARDLDTVRANRFLAFQKYGPNGPDGKPKTADDVADPFAGFTPKLPQPHHDWLAEQVKSLVDGRKHQNAGYACLLMGEVKQALSSFKRARAVCSFDGPSIEAISRDVVAGLKALNGNLLGTEEFLAFQQYGPDGKDGKPGTPDDLGDPLADF